MKRFSSVLPLALATLLAPTLAGAVTFKVNVTQDLPDVLPGDGICSADPFLDPEEFAVCTLRAAIMEGNSTAQGPVEIVLDPQEIYVIGVIGRNEDEAKRGDFDILRPMKIGVPADSIARARIDANFVDRAFDFHQNSGPSTLYGIEIENGIDVVDYYAGAAIRSDANSLRLENVDIHHCQPLGVFTTVVESSRGLFLRNSRIHHNGSQSHLALAIAARGAQPSVTLVQSTIDNNSDGGLTIQGGTLIVHSSTISSNAYDGLVVAEANATIKNSTLFNNGSKQLFLVSYNYPDASYYISLTGSILASGLDCSIGEFGGGKIRLDAIGNVVDGNGCFDHGEGLDEKNLTQASVALSPLDNWGGLTPTHVPMAGSDGIDRSDLPLSLCNELAVDQRGFPRPVASDGSPMPYCDAGAVEVQPSDALPTGPIFADSFDSI